MKDKILIELFTSFVNACHSSSVEPSWFNFGIHTDSLEFYTAEEHDQFEFHGNMGRVCTTKQDIIDFVSSVKAQNEYWKGKEGGY